MKNNIKANHFTVDNEAYSMVTNGNKVKLKSKNYNWQLDTDSGLFVRYGKDISDDPFMSPIGPELADIEITAGKCTGIHGKACTWCYKSNKENSAYNNMSLDTFAKVVNIINPYGNLRQIALGITDIDGNPDLIPIFKWCREHDITPNLTVNGANLDRVYEGKTYYEWISKYCGAVAVSHYEDDVCFNAVAKFSKAGMKQINIHKILAKETIADCQRLVNIKANNTDVRLDNLGYIIFLSLKNKGDRNKLHILSDMDEYKKLINASIDGKVGIGFDSCGAKRFLEAVKDTENYKQYETMAEPCESTLFSFYVNADGIHYPCSFCEGVETADLDWKDGIDILAVNNFIDEVWNSDRLNKFRAALSKSCRSCPIYSI